MKRFKSKYTGLQRRKAKAGYLFILPFIIGFIAFMVKPFFQSLYMSFCNVELTAGSFTPIWQGLANYIYCFRVDPEFNRLLVEEISRMMVYSVAILIFSFFVALILNQEFKGRALVRAIFFLPVILSSGVIIGLDSNNQLMANLANTIESSTQGISITDGLETVLRTAGVGTRAFETVFDLIDNIYDVAVASGIQIIIFLTGLQTIPSAMYEAAEIEGCTKWESLWKITFPMISSLLLVNWIYTVIDFSMRSDNQVIEKIQTVMIDQLNYGAASAMSWVYFVLILAFVGVTSLIINKGVYYYD
jgi:ABC-type sugar transport system permease subunit